MARVGLIVLTTTLLLALTCPAQTTTTTTTSEDCEPKTTTFGGYFSTREGKWGDTEYFEQEMNIFVERQKKLLKDPENGKFVVFQPVHTGLGNRLEGLVSTFLLAVLSERGFLVDFDYHDPRTRLPRIGMIEDTILDEPFPWQFSLLTNRVPSEYIQEHQVDIELRGGKNTYEEPLVEMMTCHDIKRHLDNRGQYILVKGNKYFGQLIANNPLYEEKLSKMFRKGTRRNMFASLLGFLIRPKPELLKEVKTFLEEHKNNERHILGVQTRTTEKYADPAQLEIYGACAELGVEEGGEGKEKGLVFLATDEVGMRGRLREKFGDRLIFHGDFIDMTSRQGRYRTTVWHGLKDIITLALVDDMIVTCGSSFSRVAIGLARKPAVVVSAGDRYCKQHQPGTCSKGASVEPCCYLWYEYNLKKTSCFNQKVHFQEMAICTNM